MMMNLFSSFDPQSLMTIHLNWMISPMCLLMIPNKFWLNSNYKMKTLYMLKTNIIKEMKPIMMNNLNKGIIVIPMSFMFVILINNVMNLFPYLFSTTAHISITLSITLPIWLTMMMFGWMKKTNFMFTHLVPQNSPPLLIPFMIIIETMSNLIRPITLSMRLAANITAGHLIITLIENTSSYLNSPFSMMTLLTTLILFSLELMVAIIQAYVFSILMILYIKEIN
uniref:ATP synthase subunit a n=1 Tax=Aposthonia borneensis TaxID=1208762 RepID=A0A678RTQ3_9NEOP|nr:ATP synthase F0 subunit 6 [Aposthonia borneensis]